MDIQGRSNKRKGKVSKPIPKRPKDDEPIEEGSIKSKLGWKGSRSPQVEGRVQEKRYLNKNKIKAHPNSGAGQIKFDGSTKDAVVELKNANKSFTMNATYLESLYKNAIQQEKDAVLVVMFPELIVECVIKRKPK